MWWNFGRYRWSNKWKNEFGIDKFYFNISIDGLIVPNDGGYNTGSKPCVADVYYTRWVVENDNMDYLKCYDKLKWGQVTTCK